MARRRSQRATVEWWTCTAAVPEPAPELRRRAALARERERFVGVPVESGAGVPGAAARAGLGLKACRLGRRVEGAVGGCLPEGIGAGTGNWRLELTTAQDIDVGAFIRTADGFLTSMHDLVFRQVQKCECSCEGFLVPGEARRRGVAGPTQGGATEPSAGEREGIPLAREQIFSREREGAPLA